MEKIREAFKTYFDEFELELPQKIEKKGTVAEHGWTITYVLTSDEQGQTCLDFLAQHRMTNMRHVRIYQNGEIKELESIQESYGYNHEIEGDQARAEREFQEHNERVAKILRAKNLI